MEPLYNVFVMPPKILGEGPFDIPEWTYDLAYDTATRYRARGWKACVIDYDAVPRLWLATGKGLPELTVSARSMDEACIRARQVHDGYDGFQLEGDRYGA